MVQQGFALVRNLTEEELQMLVLRYTYVLGTFITRFYISIFPIDHFEMDGKPLTHEDFQKLPNFYTFNLSLLTFPAEEVRSTAFKENPGVLAEWC